MDTVEKKFGELLRQERERRQLDIVELGATLKIPVENLEGIEAGDLARLPSVVYYNLFARSYSTFLGIDYTLTMDAIKSDIENAEMEKAAQARKAAGPDDEFEIDAEAEKSPLRKLLGVTAILVLLLLAYVAVDMLFIKDSTAINEQAAYLEGIDKSRLDAFAEYNWDSIAYSPPKDIKIRLLPKNESWGSVMADGDTAIFRKLVPGRVYEASAKYRMVVSIGKPAAVDIELNGRLVNLRDQESRRISRVKINQTNLESFFTKKAESSSVPIHRSFSDATTPPVKKEVKPETKTDNDTVPKEDGQQ